MGFLNNDNDKEHVKALWCVDSESGREFLLELATGKKLLERINGQIVEVTKSNENDI